MLQKIVFIFQEIWTKQTAIFHTISMIYQYQESNLIKISVAEAVSTYIKLQNYPCENKKARFLTFVFRNEANSTYIPENYYSFSFRRLQPRAGSKAFLRASNHQVEEK